MTRRTALSPPAIRDQWLEAIASVNLRHLQRGGCYGKVTLSDEQHCPVMHIAAIDVLDTTTDALRPRLAIASVQITYWPGRELARAWLAAAFILYQMHEAQELVTCALTGRRILDPHPDPAVPAAYGPAQFDRGLCEGFPTELTPSTLERTLRTVIGDLGVAALRGKEVT